MEAESQNTVQRSLYQIPTRLQVEDKIITVGGLGFTMRQTGILVIGGCLALDIWRLLAMLPPGSWGMTLRLGLTALPLIAAFLIGTIPIAGRHTEIWGYQLIRYLLLPKVYKWCHIQAREGHPHRSKTQPTPLKRKYARAGALLLLTEESEES